MEAPLGSIAIQKSEEMPASERPPGAYRMRRARRVFSGGETGPWSTWLNTEDEAVLAQAASDAHAGVRPEL